MALTDFERRVASNRKKAEEEKERKKRVAAAFNRTTTPSRRTSTTSRVFSPEEVKADQARRRKEIAERTTTAPEKKTRTFQDFIDEQERINKKPGEEDDSFFKRLTENIKKAFTGELLGKEQAKGGNILGDIALSVLPFGRIGKATKTAVQKAAQIGKIAPIIKDKTGVIIRGGAAQIKTNAKTLAQTESWLTNLLTTTRTVKQTDLATGATKISEISSKGSLANVAKVAAIGGLAGAVVGAIGSWPFAGFIEEEAIQSLQFALTSAIRNGDIEGADRAIEELEEILNPDLWDKIKFAIPYVNILDKLDKFRSAAVTSVEIQKQIKEDLRIQLETGESEDEKWVRIRELEKDNDKEIINFYNDERKRLIEWEREAKVKARNEDAAFWRKERARQAELEKKDREAIADFWLAYRKETQKIKDENRPSNLNFGLL